MGSEMHAQAGVNAAKVLLQKLEPIKADLKEGTHDRSHVLIVSRVSA